MGSTFGHEFTGIVEEVGSGVQNLKPGDHVLVPFNIACGSCSFCKQELYGNCHESNPEATAVGGIFGYSHTAGGYDGGQAEYVRVPYADVGPTIIPTGMDLDDAVMLTDVTPTGYQAAEMGGIQKGDTVVVFGAGPKSHGHIPDLITERGWRAEWKYNRKGAVKSLVVGIAVTSVMIALLAYNNKSNKKDLTARRSIPL